MFRRARSSKLIALLRDRLLAYVIEQTLVEGLDDWKILLDSCDSWAFDHIVK